MQGTGSTTNEGTGGATNQRCPSCGSAERAELPPEVQRRLREVGAPPSKTAGLLCCGRCQTIFGVCSLAVGFQVVVPTFTQRHKSSPLALRRYDLLCQRCGGLPSLRRHGWFDVDSGEIVMLGDSAEA